MISSRPLFGRILVPFLALLLGAACLVPRTAAASATDCLTGTDPGVAVDAGQIAVLEAVIDAACPCASFDGSPGRQRRDYGRCVAPLIKAAGKTGALRAKCKGRMSKAHALSTCGVAEPSAAVPCIQTTASGRRTCQVRSAAACVGKPGRYSRVACPAYRSCVAAADTNGDYLVNAGDAGTCNVPSPTPTQPPTETPTETPTQTPTSTVTPPATTTATATATETPAWVFCADQNTTCNLPGGPVVVRYGAPGHYFLKAVDASSIPCANSMIDDPEFNQDIFDDFVPPWDGPHYVTRHCDYSVNAPAPSSSCEPDFDSNPVVTVGLDAGTEFEEFVPFNRNGSFGCDVNSGCILQQTVVALDPHTFDARDSIDPRSCLADADTLDYHWRIFYPLGLTNPDVYASQGITGYFGPVLSILPNSFPNQDESTNPDTYWRMYLTVTEHTDVPMTPVRSTEVFFRFLYEGSAYGLTQSATCQTKTAVDQDCQVAVLLRQPNGTF